VVRVSENSVKSEDMGWLWSVKSEDMGWLWSVGSIKLQVSFAEYCLFCRVLLQKRPMI